MKIIPKQQPKEKPVDREDDTGTVISVSFALNQSHRRVKWAARA